MKDKHVNKLSENTNGKGPALRHPHKFQLMERFVVNWDEAWT